MASIKSAVTQLFPPKPRYTEKEVGDLSGKVYIVTGANTGVGKELAQILYSKNARVYVAARTAEKANKAIADIQAAHPGSKGLLTYLHLDLADLSTIKATADDFLARESQLHVLINNAGVMTPPQGSKSAQGYELQLGTNNLGTYLLTKLLAPVLAATAKTEPAASVRVVWVSSSAAELLSLKEVIPLDNLDYHKDHSAQTKYAVSKAGNYLHATEFARRFKDSGIISLAANPGNLDTELVRHRTNLEAWFIGFMQYPAIYGAYTELYASLSTDVTAENNGGWIIPWGRVAPISKRLVSASLPESEGGTGVAQKWWEWTEDQVRLYL